MTLIQLSAVCLIAGCEKAANQASLTRTNVSYGEITRTADWLNIHSSTIKYVEVAGERFLGVRGRPPYYLEVPGKDVIVFVTVQNRSASLLHVINIKSKEHFTVQNPGSLGRGIGAKEQKGSNFTDWIDEVLDDQVVIVSRGTYSREMTVVSLHDKRIVHKEVDYIDPNGVITNRLIKLNSEWKPKELR